MNGELVSVIIPTFNRLAKLKIALKSIFFQTYKNIEIVIVDNVSNDGTKNFVYQNYGKKIKFREINNGGNIAKSRNLGIKHSSGSILAFLDSDDYWKSTKIEKSVQLIKKGYDLVYHDMYLHQRSHQLFYKKTGYTRDLGNNVFTDLINNGPAFPTSSVVVKKKIFEDVGNFSENPELITWEDYDAWIKISKKTNSFIKLSETLGYLGIGNDNYLKIDNRIKNIFSFSEKYLNKSNLPQWCILSLAKDYFKSNHFILAYNQISKINFMKLKFYDLIKIFYILFVVKLYFFFK